MHVGSQRTAEELGRAFPGVPVRVSGARSAGGVLATVSDVPALVVATPGAEPVASGGYAAAVLLDAAVSAGQGLGAAEDAVRRWLAAAALVRSSVDGGQVLLVGDAPERAAQALVRWDPVGLASRELDERAELRLPPVVRLASVTGPRDAVTAVVERVEGVEVLGPVPVTGGGRVTERSAPGALEPDVRALLRVPRSQGHALARSLASSLAVRSARREGGTVRVQLDPTDLT
ncbi:primosomal protein N' [Cellulomonas sp. URHB0016]